jgi:uncharacterized iron-regulated protein
MQFWSLIRIVPIFFLVACSALLGRDTLQLYDLEQDRIVAGRQALARLQAARIVLVGEQHTNQWHHQVQLAVVEALHQAGADVAIGLEMFRHDRQSDLEGWISGRIDEADFKSLYLENWNYDWQFYRAIFLFARENRIPMVGLNVAPEISSQVARHGFESLSPSQRGHVDEITCDIPPEHREYLRRAHEAHAHGQLDFEHFCEAQLLWDAAMAEHALQYLEQHQDRIMVLLAGSGHARKMGIPAQLRQRAACPWVVVLPETPGIFEPQRVTAEEADFLVLGY